MRECGRTASPTAGPRGEAAVGRSEPLRGAPRRSAARPSISRPLAPRPEPGPLRVCLASGAKATSDYGKERVPRGPGSWYICSETEIQAATSSQMKCPWTAGPQGGRDRWQPQLTPGQGSCYSFIAGRGGGAVGSRPNPRLPRGPPGAAPRSPEIDLDTPRGLHVSTRDSSSRTLLAGCPSARRGQETRGRGGREAGITPSSAEPSSWQHKPSGTGAVFFSLFLFLEALR